MPFPVGLWALTGRLIETRKPPLWGLRVCVRVRDSRSMPQVTLCSSFSESKLRHVRWQTNNNNATAHILKQTDTECISYSIYWRSEDHSHRETRGLQHAALYLHLIFWKPQAGTAEKIYSFPVFTSFFRFYLHIWLIFKKIRLTKIATKTKTYRCSNATFSKDE